MTEPAAAARPEPPDRRARVAAAEIAAVVAATDARQLDELTGRIAGAERVFLSGHGRSGLMARAIAMRLMHLGLDVHAVGDTTTPAITAGDVLVVFSATGTTGSVVAQADRAAAAGATVIAVTAAATSPLAGRAGLVVRVPARGDGVGSVQHAGSLFEQTCLVLGDAVCAALQARLGLADAALDARHANLS